MELTFILTIAFFALAIFLLHKTLGKTYTKDISKKEWNIGRLYYWNWLLLISGICTAIFVMIIR